eukprot:COSAG04_NODE_2448_length_4102_cov_3.070697_4_plen_72_part_01
MAPSRLLRPDWPLAGGALAAAVVWLTARRWWPALFGSSSRRRRLERKPQPKREPEPEPEPGPGPAAEWRWPE